MICEYTAKKLYNYLYNIKDNIVAKVITGML